MLGVLSNVGYGGGCVDKSTCKGEASNAYKGNGIARM